MLLGLDDDDLPAPAAAGKRQKIATFPLDMPERVRRAGCPWSDLAALL